MDSKFKQIFGTLLVAQLSNSLLLHLVAVLLFHGHSLFKCLKCRNRICWTLPLMKKRCFKCLFALFQSGHLLQQCFSVPDQHLSIARAAAVSWYSNLKTSCDHFFVYGSGPPSSASLRSFSLGWQCHPQTILCNQDSQKTYTKPAGFSRLLLLSAGLGFLQLFQARQLAPVLPVSCSFDVFCASILVKSCPSSISSSKASVSALRSWCIACIECAWVSNATW